MAIETTYIYSTNHSDLLAWLQANAVPAYFDSVAADETTPSIIHCYVEDVELLTVSFNSKGSTQFTATNAAGKTTTCSYNYSGYSAYYGYKCANGLAIAVGSGTAKYIPVFITKDSSDHTTVIISSTVTNQTSTYPISCVDRADPLFSISTSPTAEAAVTTLVPFACGNTTGENRYTPNAFYMPTAQYSTIGKLVIDGVTYLSNGTWLLKDA